MLCSINQFIEKLCFIVMLCYISTNAKVTNLFGNFKSNNLKYPIMPYYFRDKCGSVL